MRTIRTLAIAATALAFGTVAIGVYWHIEYGPTEFERSVWLQGETAHVGARFRMADGLLRSNVLLGKPRAEIVAMLGQPTATDKFRDSGLIYWLGSERGFISIDSEWLMLNFDEADRVREVRIVRD